MSLRSRLATTYDPDRVIQPIYTGGDVALDEEGRILATCLGEEAIITDLGTGQLLARIEGDGETLTTLSLTPSASHLVTCSRSLSLKIYTIEPSDSDSPFLRITLARTIKPHSTPVVVLTIDETESLVATGAADGSIKVWDIRRGYSTHTFRGHSGVISALHFFHLPDTPGPTRTKNSSSAESQNKLEEYSTPDASQKQANTLRLASGGDDGKVRVWNLFKRKALVTLDSHVSVVRSLHFSTESRVLVSGSRDKTAIVWDAESWTTRKVIPILEGIESALLSVRGDILFTGGEHGRLRLWNPRTGHELTHEQTTLGQSDAIVHMIFHAKKNFLLTVHANQALLLHSTSSVTAGDVTGKRIAPLPIVRRISGTHDEIIDLAYMMPDQSLLALASNSEDIRLVSLADSSPSNGSIADAEYFGADVASLQGHRDIIICLAVDSSGHWLVTGAKDNAARLWCVDRATETYEHYVAFTGHAESIGAVALPHSAIPMTSTGGKNPLENPPPFLLTGSQDRTIKRWTIPRTRSSPKALYTRKAHDKDINALAFSPTSQLFASASQDRTVKIWSTEEGETQGVLRGHKRGVWSVVFAPKDTPNLANANGGPASGGRGLILTSSGDKTLKIWSLNDYTCLRTLEGHTNTVLKVLWLPPPPIAASSDPEDAHAAPKKAQDSTVASAGSDGLLKLWSPVSGECLTTLDNHTDRIWALAFNEATRTIVSGGGDSVITFWKDTSKETAAEKSKVTTERVEQDQELRNCEKDGRWREGIVLALQLNHPARLLGLFQRVVDTSPPEAGSITGIRAVDEVMAALSDEQLLSLLLRVRDWNTNARTSPVAQKVLNVVVRRYSAKRLANLGRRKGGKEVVEALRVYTERHYRRIEELWGESFVVDFLLGEMEQLGVKEGIDGVSTGDEDVIMA